MLSLDLLSAPLISRCTAIVLYFVFMLSITVAKILHAAAFLIWIICGATFFFDSNRFHLQKAIYSLIEVSYARLYAHLRMRSYQSMLHHRNAFLTEKGRFRNFIRERRANPFSLSDAPEARARTRRAQRRRYNLALFLILYIMFYSTFLRFRRPHIEKTLRTQRWSDV